MPLHNYLLSMAPPVVDPLAQAVLDQWRQAARLAMTAHHTKAAPAKPKPRPLTGLTLTAHAADAGRIVLLD
jgi:hypothetical protein